MSNGYDNSNEGVLFSAADKKRKETDRDYSGNAEVVCPHCNKNSDHWISAWINKSAAGMKYMKLKFNAKDAAPSGGSTYGKNADGTTKPPPADIDDSDIPF